MIVNMSNELLNTPLSPDEIQPTHRVRHHCKNGSPHPVIVKFLSYKSREKVFRAASKLPMEDLTKDRSKVFSIARQLKKNPLMFKTVGHRMVLYL